MSEHYYAVIMAGGGGTRLWPLSRGHRPKQVLRLFGDRSMFQIAVQRLDGLFPPDRILVVTVDDQAGDLQEQAPEIPEENFLLEPMPRGTASVVGLAAVALARRDPHAVMAVLTADHYIGSEDRFRLLLQAARDVAAEGYLVTLGITPTHPATKYGYIRYGRPLGTFQGLEVFNVARFKEKPAEDAARAFLESGDHAWNSGMFVWRVDRLQEEIERQMPDLNRGLKQVAQDWGSSRQAATLAAVWSRLTPQTIDYGIMEGADRAAIIPARELGWNDVGSWDALFEVLSTDQNGNIMLNREHLILDTQNTLLYGDGPERLVVAIGLQDLVIVDTEDVLLICHKGQAQQVREAVRALGKIHGERYS